MKEKQENQEGAVKQLKKYSVNKEKVVIISLIVAVLLAAGGIFGFYYYKANVEAVVTFEGGKVTKAEYSIYYKIFAETLSYYGYSETQIPEYIAQKAGVDKMLYLKAKEAGITQTDEQKQEVDEIFADEDQVSSLVEQGIDPDKMKELYYQDNIINNYIEKLEADVSNDDMIAYIKETYGEDADLNEYVTRQILFSTTDSTTGSELTDEEKAEAKTKAEEILAKVKAGEDFATLAKENSDDSGTSEDGGEYKMYMDDSTVTEYEDAVKTLKAGEIYSTLVESDYGYHIIKLESINENGRANSTTERSNYVNSKIIDVMWEQLEVNDDVVNKVVYEITGSYPSDEDDSTTTTTDEDTTTTDEDTTTTTTENE